MRGGEEKRRRNSERVLLRWVIESGEILIRVIDIDGVKIHFGWIPEGVVVREVMVGVVVEVGGRRGGGFDGECSLHWVHIIVIVVVFIVIMVIVYRIEAEFSWIGLRRQEGLSRGIQFRHCWCPYGLPKSWFLGSLGVRA